MHLTPFDENTPYQVGVKPRLTAASWILEFEVIGPLDELLWDPKLSGLSSDLWKKTCFEFFISLSDGSYFEWNGSPSGAWSVFRFLSYRTQVPHVVSGTAPSLQVDRHLSEKYQFRWDLPLGLFPGAEMPQARVSFNTILMMRDGRQDFFASKHLGEKPDFHNQKAWITLEQEWCQK
jgi:hypothetical protein